MTPKEERTDASEEAHPLSYFVDDPMLRFDDFDFCAPCSGDGIVLFEFVIRAADFLQVREKYWAGNAGEYRIGRRRTQAKGLLGIAAS